MTEKGKINYTTTNTVTQEKVKYYQGQKTSVKYKKLLK